MVDQMQGNFCEGPIVNICGLGCHLVCVVTTHLALNKKGSRGLNRCGCVMIKLYLQRGEEARLGLQAEFASLGVQN